MKTPNWIKELPAAISVADDNGTILYMNDKELQSVADQGGRELIGSNLFDCHPEPAKTRTRELFVRQTANHYTIRKNGQKKIIHQLPWHKNGVFAGYVEISIPIPDAMPHFDRK